MIVREVYFNTGLDLDALALSIRRLLNIAETNKSPYCVDQRRFSLNKGGHYYLFEVFGLRLELIANTGEAAIPERRDAEFYLLVYSEEVQLEESTGHTLASHICALMRTEGITAEVDSLSS